MNIILVFEWNINIIIFYLFNKINFVKLLLLLLFNNFSLYV